MVMPVVVVGCLYFFNNRGQSTVIDHLPFTIVEPGRYVISQDLRTTTAHAITINCDDVEIDGHGKLIAQEGSEQEFSIGIYALSRSRIHIHDVTLASFTYGIHLDAPYGTPELNARMPRRLKVSNTCLHACKFRGIGMHGIDSEISDCVFWKTGGARMGTLSFAMGIELMGSGNKVTGNHIIDTFSSSHLGRARATDLFSEAVGISLSSGCSDTTVNDNQILNSRRAYDPWHEEAPDQSTGKIRWQRTIGIWISDDSHRAKITRNIVRKYDWGVATNATGMSPSMSDCHLEDCGTDIIIGAYEIPDARQISSFEIHNGTIFINKSLSHNVRVVKLP